MIYKQTLFFALINCRIFRWEIIKEVFISGNERRMDLSERSDFKAAPRIRFRRVTRKMMMGVRYRYDFLALIYSLIFRAFLDENGERRFDRSVLSRVCRLERIPGRVQMDVAESSGKARVFNRILGQMGTKGAISEVDK